MGEISKTGVFYDTAANKVVEKQPEEGIQLVAPGAEITDADQARIDNYGAPKTDEEAATVTTATASGKKG